MAVAVVSAVAQVSALALRWAPRALVWVLALEPTAPRALVWTRALELALALR
ncbi:hypothetical protein ACEXQE_05440 [Herbiconiux sp. P17]|uniref:hypothetical protein n=1 Tax=Herbiconiux wuyangfengii TaxID=3342794 RepID=UPI0035B9F9F5